MSEITVDQLVHRLARGEELALIDIRPPGAFAEWRIPGAVNLPVIEAMRVGDARPLAERAADLPADRPIVFVCNVGRSSRVAADFAAPLGFEALSLTGGMRSWSLAHTEAAVTVPGRPDITLIQVRRNGKGCLSYVLGHEGMAVVIDPSVDDSVYRDLGARHGLSIGCVLETHIHADHVSRARDLARSSAASLCLPRNGRVTYDYRAIEDGEVIVVGGLVLRALSTPGHTEESTCYRLDEALLFTGDTLFTEGVGRPDLEKGDAGAEAGARALHASLHESVLALPDDVRIYPAHTSRDIGFDGAPISARLGDLRTTLPLLQADGPGFIAGVVAGIGAKPPSFEAIIRLNEGRADLGGIDPVDLEAGPNRCAVAQPFTPPGG